MHLKLVPCRSLSDGVQEDVLKFVNDSTARDAFEARTLPNVWSKMNESYPYVAETSVGVLLVFPCTYSRGNPPPKFAGIGHSILREPQGNIWHCF